MRRQYPHLLISPVLNHKPLLWGAFEANMLGPLLICIAALVLGIQVFSLGLFELLLLLIVLVAIWWLASEGNTAALMAALTSHPPHYIQGNRPLIPLLSHEKQTRKNQSRHL